LFKRDNFQKTKTELQDLTIQATKDIETIFKQAMVKVDDIANGISSGHRDQTEILQQVKTLVASNPNYYGSSITFRPYGYDPAKRLYAPYYHRVIGEEGKLELARIEDSYDYTEQDYDWYVRPMKDGNSWGEPYWDPAGKTYMITYSSVFYDNNSISGEKIPLGVVTLDISMDYIKEIIEGINLGASGFGALVSSKGLYLYHPNTEYVISQKTITDVAKEKNDKDRLVMAAKAAKGEGGFLDHISTTTHQKAWLVFEPVPLTGWSLQNTFLKDDISIDVDTFRHHLIWIVVSVLFFLLLSTGILYAINSENRLYNGLLIFLGSVLTVISVGSIWSIALTYNPADKIKGIRISDKATLEKTLKEYRDQSEKFHFEAPLFVPTGVYIDAVKFSGPSDVFLSGYVWQKYNADFPSDLEKEFMISKATKVSIEKLNSSTGMELKPFSFTSRPKSGRN
jgi:hypothetical protein